ncbi:MAG: lysophospholipid acyltransferase family protein [candidate division KSB1 bacterium]|nr:lysophospholipid acyltransferase family protein [candidate division KSB1 bacterium]
MISKKYKFEYYLTKFLGTFAKFLPVRTAHLFGNMLGDLFFYVIKSRKRVAFRNLKMVFGDTKSDKSLKKILREHYRHFGCVLMEFARIPSLTKESIENEIPIHHQEILNEALSAGKGCIVITGHFGNWEYLAAGLTNSGYKLSCIYREQKNVAVDKVIQEYRKKLGLELLKVRGGAAKGMVSAIRKKKSILSVMDQDAGRKGVFVDFLGYPASVNRGTAALALKYKVPVVAAFGVRKKDRCIHIEIEKFRDIHSFSDGEDGIIEFIKEYNGILEAYIRRYPAQWFWMHRRWKTQPSGSSL